MRVIGINAVFGRLSTGTAVRQLNEGLKAYGVSSTTVFSAGEGGEGAVRMGSPQDVKLHSLLARLTGRPGGFSRRATRRMLEYLDAERPDIVHLHNLHGNYICLPELFAYLAKRRIPTVVTLHDCWWYTGRCCHYTVEGCMKWQSACGNCPRLKKDIPSWFFDRSARMLEDKKRWFASLDRYAVIGVSDWITNEARKSFLGGADVIERVYNWVDTETFRPVRSDIRERYGIGRRTLLLGAASKWTADKGLEAFAELSRRLGDDMRLALIGDLPAGAPEGILRVGTIRDEAELARWYSAADVLVNLSPEESFGKVAAEALACGTPIVCLDSTANPELAGAGCGTAVAGTDPEEILCAVRGIVRNGKSAYSEACRGFALENFGMKENIAKVCDVYKRLLNKE